MTHPMVYRVRHATQHDYDDVLSLRCHAEVWLREAGITQWTDRQAGIRSISTRIQEGSMFVVETGAGDPIGCLALGSPDPDFWRPDEQVQPALYLYKLIIRSDRRSRGLGEVLMDWACRRAQESGARWLRMDCWKTNVKLQQYYEQRGFSHVDTRDAPGRNSGWLAQRDVETQTADPEQLGIMLIDDSNPTRPAALPLAHGDRYDPTGEAAIWQKAANRVQERALDEPPVSDTAWNDGLTQAARDLENVARNVRQAGGMYHRVFATQ